MEMWIWRGRGVAQKEYRDLLAPCLAGANPALLRQIPGVAEGNFSAGGSRPVNNELCIDRVEDNDECTGLSQTEPLPEEISYPKIVNHGYAARSGGAADDR
jgi:hypothetical protein